MAAIFVISNQKFVYFPAECFPHNFNFSRQLEASSQKFVYFQRFDEFFEFSSSAKFCSDSLFCLFLFQFSEAELSSGDHPPRNSALPDKQKLEFYEFGLFCHNVNLFRKHSSFAPIFQDLKEKSKATR